MTKIKEKIKVVCWVSAVVGMSLVLIIDLIRILTEGITLKSGLSLVGIFLFVIAVIALIIGKKF